MEVFDEEPGLARLLEGLQAIARLIVFDRRGVGASDPITDWDRQVLDQCQDLDPCTAFKDEDVKFGNCIGEVFAYKYMSAGIERM